MPTTAHGFNRFTSGHFIKSVARSMLTYLAPLHICFPRISMRTTPSRLYQVSDMSDVTECSNYSASDAGTIKTILEDCFS